MACSSSTSPPTKQLGELLKEQQEPFTLDAYLSERWYLKNTRSYSYDFNKRRKPVSYRGKLKSLLEKLNSVSHRKRLSHCKNSRKRYNYRNNDSRIGEGDRIYSARSFVSVSNCRQQTDFEKDYASSKSNFATLKLHNSKASKYQGGVDIDGNYQWRCMEDSKQLSPVSVLEESCSVDGSPVHINEWQFHIRREEETTSHSILSASLELSENPTELLQINIHHRQELIFDYFKEDTESHEKIKERWKSHGEMLGREEIENIISEELCLWHSKTELTNLYFSIMGKNWRHQTSLRVIGREIEAAILEEIVSEMVDLYLQ